MPQVKWNEGRNVLLVAYIIKCPSLKGTFYIFMQTVMACMDDHVLDTRATFIGLSLLH